MTVSVEKDGPLTTIVLSRSEVRNAVDRKTAQELADAFRSFETDRFEPCAGSHFEQFDLPFEQAMANEFKHGLRSLEKEARTGAARFAKGAGRHGHFEKPD
jgi:enoyl-CoA hydratase